MANCSVVLSVIVLLCCVWASANATSKRAIAPLKLFKGVDTIGFDVNWGPSAYGLLDIREDKTKPVYPPMIVRTALERGLLRLLGDRHDIKMVALIANPTGYVPKAPTSLFLHVNITGRTDNFEGRKIALANMAVSFERKINDADSLKFELPNITYPFIIPKSEDALEEKIVDGITYLLGFMPDYIQCANATGKVNNCDLSYDYKKVEEPR
jgi:hypothetical protein